MKLSKNFRLLALAVRLQSFGITSPNTMLSLLRLERKINKLDCDLCNGDLQENEEDGTFVAYRSTTRGNRALLKVLKQDPRIKLLKRAESLLPLGLNVRHQSDPRGCSVYLCKAGVEVGVCL